MVKTKILFVCLGNICRSPLAKALFDQQVKAAGRSGQFITDSAGTANYHVGNSADARTIRNARKNGLELNHRARQFTAADFHRFDFIIVMDRSNFSDVSGLTQDLALRQKIHLMRAWDEHNKNSDVPDPWFGGDAGFQEVFDILNRCASGLFDSFHKIN